MKIRNFILFLIMCGYACTPPGIQTSWKPVLQQPANVNKILVAVILPEEDSMLRKKLELQLSAELNKIGYHSVSAWQEFGKQGLAKFGQEQTYVTLCENGFDAVLTLAVLDEVKGEDPFEGRVQGYSNSYYYNRIWNYKRVNKEEMADTPKQENRVFIEAFLFDLKQLQTIYFSDTRSFNASASESQLQRYAQAIFNDMLKRRLLIKKPRPRAA